MICVTDIFGRLRFSSRIFDERLQRYVVEEDCLCDFYIGQLVLWTTPSFSKPVVITKIDIAEWSSYRIDDMASGSSDEKMRFPHMKPMFELTVR